MRKEVFFCDRCGKELPEDYNPLEDQVRIPVDKQTCPAGGAAETVYAKIDSCPHCLAIAISKWFDKYRNDWGEARAFVELLKKGTT